MEHPFNESSNDASNLLKGDYFFSEDSNLVSAESSQTKLFENEENSCNVSTSPEEDQVEDSKEDLSRFCYCLKERNFDVVELQCAKCLRWCHETCLTIKLDKVIQFMTSYTFFCKHCTATQIESFVKRQTNFSQICQTTLANLMHRTCDKVTKEPRIAFSKDKEIIPFIEANWDSLTTFPRRIKNSWHNTVFKTMSKDSETFMCDNRDPDDILFALRSMDLLKIAPNYSNIKYHGLNANDQQGYNNGSSVFRSARGMKRKVNSLYQDGTGDLSQNNRKQKSELVQPKLPSSGFPTEYPYNKETYRYFLAEPDENAPGKQEYEESQDYGAGKPIPNWLFRRLVPEKVLLSMHDRAPQLKISEDRSTVVGEKGYSSVRASNGVTKGIWYYEIKINEMPENSATRIGWSQELANLQTPLGYDKFGYAWRSRKGTKFHESIGKHYADGGFGVGDVLGCLIDLPHEINERNWSDIVNYEYPPFLPKTYKDLPLIKFKYFHYFEEKDEVVKAAKELKPLAGSKIVFYKNGNKIGTAFEDIYNGVYYPAAGLYKNISITFNFGPNFAHPPTDSEYGSRYRGMHEAVFESQIEQSLADMLFLVENESQLTLEKFYNNYNKAP